MAVNHARTARGLRPLQVDPALTRAARTHSQTLLERDVVVHGAVAARLASFGARGPSFGENVACAAGSSARAGVILRTWLASPDHRANLLRPGWQRLGIGTAVGEFAGDAGATVFTADFAGS